MEPTNTKLTVPFRVSESAFTYAKTLGLDIIVDPVAKRVNKHAEAAIERLACEHAILGDFHRHFGPGSVLVDVYANAVRSVRSIERLGLEIVYFPIMLNKCQNDVGRRAAATAAGIPYSDEPLAAYTCSRQVDAFTFTHALYYEEPQVLIDAMIRNGCRRSYSVQHNFTQAAARLCNGKVAYHYTSDCRIQCVADGDDHTYLHGAMHWIQGAPINFECAAGKQHLVWHVLEKVGDSFVYVFDIEDGHVPCTMTPRPVMIADTANPELHPVGESVNFTTSLNRELRSPTLDLAYIPVTSAFFFYGLFGLQLGNGEFIPLPRGLIGSLALTAAGEVRCPALYTLLLARAKNALRELNYPVDLAARAAVYCAVSALILDVEFETVSLGTVTRLYSRLFHLHSRVLDFEPAYLVGARVAMAATAIVISGVVPMHYYGIDGLLLGAGKVAVGAAFAHPFISVPAIACASLYGWLRYQRVLAHRSAEARMWCRFRDNLMPGPVGRTLHFDTAPKFAASSKPKTKDLTLKSSARIVIHTDMHQPDVRAAARRGLVLHGLGIQESTPSYVAKTVENAVHALSSRSLSKNAYKIHSIRWFRIYARITGNPGYSGSVLGKFILGKLRNLNDGTFGQWVSRFPTNTKANLELAKESLKSEALNAKDLRLAGIVKLEKSGTMTVAGDPPEIDGRIVMSCSPRANASFGPPLWCIGNVLKVRFAPGDGKFLVWDCGLSAEELGSLYDEWTDLFSTPQNPCTYIVLDRKRFEKHQGQEAQTLVNLVLKGAELDPQLIAMHDKMHRVRGSMQGLPVSFSLDEPTKVSGGNATSWANFMVNAAGIVEALGEPGPKTYGMVVKGDDVLAVCRSDLGFTWELIESAGAELGLPVTGCLTKSRADVEFASNIPYPSRDGTVFGPKIGRTLQRFGWTVSGASPDVYGAATSLTTTVNHIPFLRQFIEKHRGLSVKPDVAPAKYFKYKTLASVTHESCPDTYAFLEERYGLTPSLEDKFVERLSEITSLPASISWPLIDTLVARDE